MFRGRFHGNIQAPVSLLSSVWSFCSALWSVLTHEARSCWAVIFSHRCSLLVPLARLLQGCFEELKPQQSVLRAFLHQRTGWSFLQNPSSLAPWQLSLLHTFSEGGCRTVLPPLRVRASSRMQSLTPLESWAEAGREKPRWLFPRQNGRWLERTVSPIVTHLSL